MFHVHVTYIDGTSQEFTQGDAVSIGTWLSFMAESVETVTISPIR